MDQLPQQFFTSALVAISFLILPDMAQSKTPTKRPPTVKIIESKANSPVFRAENWQTPRPPYPVAARARREHGSMNVEITTGPDGRVIKATVPKSKDHPNLDVSTARWAYLNWSGPPNHRTIIPVAYELR